MCQFVSLNRHSIDLGIRQLRLPFTFQVLLKFKIKPIEWMLWYYGRSGLVSSVTMKDLLSQHY